MDATELIHLSGTLADDERRRLEAIILEAETALGSERAVAHLGKPWVVVVQSVGQRRVYLASRLGTPHHFVGQSLDELIEVFTTWIAQRPENDVSDSPPAA